MDRRRLSRLFLDRFRGLMRAHGTYITANRKDNRGKVKGQARTLKEPVTEEVWQQHLAGKVGLGVVPIDDDGMSWFGAIDVDVYNLDLEQLEKKIRYHKLPLIVCRTKSGGAHLYLFLSKPATAAFVRDTLMEWSVILGYPQVEIFPKQAELAGEDDCGSWINMPYFNGERTDRYALHDGRMLTQEEFLEVAERHALSEPELKALNIGEDSELQGAPPCLQHLARVGFEEGSRNLALFDLAVFCRMKYADDWEKHVDPMNQRYMRPHLTSQEVALVVKSCGRKNYFYRCRDAPINAVCNRVVCAKREYGIKQSNTDPGVTLDGLVKIKTDPPMWLVNVDGKRVKMMSSSDFLQYPRFQQVCVDGHNILPNFVKREAWAEIIRALLDKVEEQAAPEDTGPSGEFLTLLEKFCTEKVPASHHDEILTGRPWEENGRVIFRSIDMLEWMRKRKFSIGSREAWMALSSLNARHELIRIKGKKVRVWSIPAFTKQTEPLEVPDVSNKEEAF